MVEAVEVDGGMAAFQVRGRRARARLKKAAYSLPDGYIAEGIGHEHAPDEVSLASSEFVTFLTVRRSQMDLPRLGPAFFRND